MRLRPAVSPCPRSSWRASAANCGRALVILGSLVGVYSGAMAADAPVYRCGNSYSSQPCPGGSALDLADPRSAAQQREAREASERDAALARQMKTQRVADERAAPKGGAANLGAVAAIPPAKATSKPHASPHKKTHKAVKPAKSASATR
jgi:hypothetical protein